jgi:multimeric flavodoxin WrbA
MQSDLSRRKFLEGAGTVVAAGAALASASGALAGDAPARKPVKIMAISTSPRKRKTTAAGLKICLDAAKAVDPEHIETELVELAGINIPGGPAVGLPSPPGELDGFPPLLSKLTDPSVAGIIVGTPVYFGNMSYLCAAFLDRCNVLRKNFAWSNKVGGVLAVGGSRNGGQEQTLRSVHTAMFGQEMIVVGDGRPTAHCGATLWNNGKDDIAHDEPGIASAKNLGRRVAEVARLVAGGASGTAR